MAPLYSFNAFAKHTKQIYTISDIPSVEKIYERYLSSYKEERYSASKILTGPVKGKGNLTVDKIRRALYASKICVYAQGFDMILKASQQYEWNLNCGEISKIFRGGCIIRAGFLNQIASAYQKDASLNNLLLDPFFSQLITKYELDWRRVVADAVLYGTAVPAFSSAIAHSPS